MMRVILAAFVGLLFGALIGSSVARHNASERQHVRAVMWLSQINLDRLMAAKDAKQCESAARARTSLRALATELPLALPKTYAQDATFRQYTDHFLDSAGNDKTTSCSEDFASAEIIHERCDACHRDYRQ